jgi:NADH:ubiquinone oxidoreductase subunit C
MSQRQGNTSEESTLSVLISYLGQGRTIEAKTPRARRAFLTLPPESFRDALAFLVNEEGFRHLSTVTAVDVNDHMEVIYHLSSGGVSLSLRIPVPKDKLVVPSIVDLVPGAVLYEREVHELFGIVFEGHPDLRPLLLPDCWPEGLYPMRKNLSLVQIRGVLADARATAKLGR